MWINKIEMGKLGKKWCSLGVNEKEIRVGDVSFSNTSDRRASANAYIVEDNDVVSRCPP